MHHKPFSACLSMVHTVQLCTWQSSLLPIFSQNMRLDCTLVLFFKIYFLKETENIQHLCLSYILKYFSFLGNTWSVSSYIVVIFVYNHIHEESNKHILSPKRLYMEQNIWHAKLAAWEHLRHLLHSVN